MTHPLKIADSSLGLFAMAELLVIFGLILSPPFIRVIGKNFYILGTFKACHS